MSDNKFRLVITGTLSKDTYAELQKDIIKIQNKIPSIKIKGKVDIDSKDLELYKKKMENALARLQIGKDKVFARDEIRKELGAFTNDLQKVGQVGGKSTKELGVQFDTLKTNVAKASNEMKTMHGHTDKLAESMRIAAYKMFVWTAVGGVLFGVGRSIRDALTYVVELDGALNQIRIVTGQSQEQVNELAKSYNKLAKEMSVTTTQIAQAAVEFYRQGLSQDEVNKRLQDTIKYAKISALQFEDAAQIITATANSMELDTERIIDVFAYMGDATATGKYMCPAA